jgi:carbon monoxide dehydrogenase subunit G
MSGHDRFTMTHRATVAFPVGPDRVWADMEQVEHFGRWWGWLHEYEVEGDGLVAGTIMRGVIVPPVPYRMRVEVRLVEVESPTRVAAHVTGDLEGPASVVLEPSDAGCRATVAWHFEMRKLSMRAAATIAYPMLRWGHDRVVQAAVEAYRRRLTGSAR